MTSIEVYLKLQITLYHDTNNLSPFSHRDELALLEAGASYTGYGFEVYSRPSWFSQVNETGKVPAITYGGPNVHPEEPSPLSFKLAESSVILEFIADLFPNVQLLPPLSDPIERARVRLFLDSVARNVEGPIVDLIRGLPDVDDNIIEGLLKIQALLPDADAVGGEFVLGKDFTIADCAIAPILAFVEAVTRPGVRKLEPGSETKLQGVLEGVNFERSRRYKEALWERESVKKLLDIDRLEAGWRKVFA